MKTKKEITENANNNGDKTNNVYSDIHDNSEVIMDPRDEIQYDGRIDLPLDAP